MTQCWYYRRKPLGGDVYDVWHFYSIVSCISLQRKSKRWFPCEFKQIYINKWTLKCICRNHFQSLYLWFLRPTQKNFSSICRCVNFRKKTAKFDLRLAPTAIQKWGSLSTPNLLRHRGHRFLWSYRRTRVTYACCQAFGSGSAITCLNDLGLYL